MEIKRESGKGQFRWRLLVFVFFTCAALAFPLAMYLGYFNFVAGILVGLILAIPVNVCVLLQKNWSMGIKAQVILYIILCFAIIPQESLFIALPGSGNLIVSYLFYRFALKQFHERYDGVEYTVVYLNKGLLWSTYISIFFTAFILLFIIIIITLSVPGQSSELEGYRVMVSRIPLFPFIVSPLFAIPAQIFVCIQKEWYCRNKIINILAIELVFLGVGVIVTLLHKYLVIFSWPIIPFIPLAGGALLRYIFLKSSEGRIDRGE